ncbi:MAG: FAD:protein FMN transferase [Spirochaetales bacterium]|nr:FAD:protein FMN transferase [Spirochaetales bacterium]
MSSQRTVSSFKIMGTLATLCIPGEVDDRITSSVYSELRSLERRLTVNGSEEVRASSQVDAINKAAGDKAVVLDEDVYSLVRSAVLASQKYKNSFNAFMGPVVKAWGIGFDNARVPSNEEIKKLLSLTNPFSVELNDSDRSVKLKSPGMQLDLGAIAKGFSADCAGEIYRQNGINQGLIDLGGNVLAMGGSEISDDRYWTVGIQSPFHTRGTILGHVKIRDASAVTSGIYERVFEIDGKQYHHMLDPNTGYPFETNLASVTIIAEHSITADLWATIAQRNGLNEGYRVVEEASGVEAILVTRDCKVLATSGIKDKFTLVSSEFQEIAGL